VAPVLLGSPATLTATVSPAAATGTVTFSSGGTTLCTGSLSSGAASCTATFAQTGSYTITATYNGDGVYPKSSGTTVVLVYALAPGGGSFVVGDRSAAGTVTFWGSQWWKTNVLSAGGAPSAFKGFALNGPAKCGATWSTDPGNSSPPPAGPLPAYMAVIVTSNSTQSGSQISGTIASIVIVKTDAGYDANPGHAGTGTVVATVCGG
ncbi:MAG TPA: Ig-like domain-containing protein, partial [Gaiellaceae bacterium]